mgnify:CR=1 FL=1
MELFAYLSKMLWHPIALLLDPTYQTFWFTYVCTALFVVCVYFWKRRGKSTHFRSLIQYLFPRKLFLHPSTLLDLKLYIAGTFFIFLQASILTSFSLIINDTLEAGLIYVSGTPEGFYKTVPVWYKIFFPVAFILLLELGYWFTHYIMHKVPFLWEYHKVHHSAVIMTPLTELRQHPLELFLFPFFIALATAPLYAFTFWLFGESINLYYFWSFPFFLMVTFSTIGHLRHSHVNIGANRFWAHIIQTPAHHHIHHSADSKHFDTNLGFCLSVWDWAFGTLCIPKKGQRITFGIQDDLKHSNSFIDHWAQPVVQSFRVLTGGKEPFSSSRFLKEEKNTPEN